MQLQAMIGLAVILVLGVPLVVFALTDEEVNEQVQQHAALDEDISSFQNEIDEKSNKVEELTKQLYVYEKNLRQKQEEELTLESEIELLDEKAEQTSVNVEKMQTELDVYQLEIEVLSDTITRTNEQIASERKKLAEVVRSLYAVERKKPIELAFSNSNFADFFRSMEYTDRLQQELAATVEKVKATKQRLEDQQGAINEKKSAVAKEKIELELFQKDLESQGAYKEQLLDETELDEDKFQELVQQVRTEQSNIEATIASLEKKAQARLENIRAEVLKKLESQTGTTAEEVPDEDQSLVAEETQFIWPVSSRTVTCGFRCEDYPFRRYFEHSGTDIATPFGTSVASSASGYVAIAKFDGTSNYAYVMIVHGDGLSTVYGHLSDVYVSVDQYVKQGEIIGKSGGLPGTPGAGSYSTGAHLHFEIRVDGIPTNALDYLP